MNTIALVGRPNVGKSLLFNRLARKDLALVHDRPGVTRDRLITECHWNKHPITLIDTGGIGLEEEADFSQAIQQEAELALTVADLIFWVVDGRDGLTALDLEIANQLRKIKKPLFIVVNKMDDPKQTFFAHEFLKLGFHHIFSISAAHGLGIDNLIQAAISQLPNPSLHQKPVATATPPRLAFVGRPNVGKSSLINAVLQDPRTIVSEISGTTRDAVEIPYFRQTTKRSYLLIDTAGMRHKSHLRDPLERQMTSRTAYAIQRANLCLLVIDADRGVTEQDKKVAGLIEKAQKPCLILINKWDLTRGLKLTPSSNSSPKSPLSFKETYLQAVQNELFFLYEAPILFVSALKKSGIDPIFEAIEVLEKRVATPLTTGILNRLLQKVMQRHPPPIRQGKRFKILYLTAINSEKRLVPPTFIGFCNNPKLIVPSWFTFFEAQIRKHFNLQGCPLIWQWKSRLNKSSKPKATQKIDIF